MKLGTAELLSEDRDDKNQVPPVPFEKEEEFLEQILESGDANDIVLVTVLAVVGLVMFTNIIFCIGYLKSRCKRAERQGNDAETNEKKEDLIQMVTQIAREQHELSGLIDKGQPVCKSCRH